MGKVSARTRREGIKGLSRALVPAAPARAHKRLSPSASERWIECPGSVALIEALPADMRSRGSTFADQGTAAHKLLETCLREGVDAGEYLGRSITVTNDGKAWVNHPKQKHYGDAEKNSFAVDDDMADAVQVCIDHVRDEMERLGPNTEMMLEAKCVPFDDTEEGSGTGDVVLDAWPKELVIIDYKHGAGVPVEIDGNTQLRCYASGAAAPSDFDYKRIRTTIVQPRCQHIDGPVRTKGYDADDIRSFHKFLRKAIERAEAPDAPLKAGDHCRWCEAAATCPKLRDRVQDTALADFAEDFDDDVKLVVPNSPSKLAAVLPHVPMVEAWCKAVMTAGLQTLVNGDRLKGFKIVEKRSSRKLKGLPEKKLKRILETRFGVSSADAYSEPKLKTAPQIEKLVHKSKRRAFNDELVVKHRGGITIAPDRDPRPAIAPADASVDFDDVEDDE